MRLTTAHMVSTPYGFGNIGMDIYTVASELDNTIPAMRIRGNNDVEIAGNLTVTGTFTSSGSVVITTTESNAGFKFGTKDVKVRRVTGTSPTNDGAVDLFTPSTGSASQLLDTLGWFMRSGASQRHIVSSVHAQVDIVHISPVWQDSITGAIKMYMGNAAYQGVPYDLAIYYTL